MPENYGDLAIPEIKLVQNVGGDEAKQVGAKPGDFYCAITQEIIPGEKGFEIVVVKPAHKNRTYWGTTDISDDPPVCASNDGIMSVAGDICATACPYKAFNDAPYMLSPTERRAKCTPNYNVIGIKVSDMMPVLIRCSGISSMAAKELNTLLKFHKNIKGQYFKAKIRVSAIKKKTASGEAFAIKFGDPEPITDNVIMAELKEQMAQLVNVEMPAPPELPEGQTQEPGPDNVIAPFDTRTDTAKLDDTQRLAAQVKEKLAQEKSTLPKMDF